MRAPSKLIQPQKASTSKELPQCWAHCRNGKRCQRIVQKSSDNEPIPIPYCPIHLKYGDGALKVISHPQIGKCLVARFNLPRKYRMVYHGRRGKCKQSCYEDRNIAFYPPCQTSGRNRDKDGTLIAKYNGVLNPVDTGDCIQYAACPGPDERQNMRSTFQYFGKRNCQIGGLEFICTEAVPENTQLCHWYGPGWWSAREIKRSNVGTEKYPAPIRNMAKKKEN